MNEKIVEPKPGYYVLGGKFKIEQYDKLNYVVCIKDDSLNPGNIVKKSTNKKSNVTYLYKTDGYKLYHESYFSTVSAAARHILEKILPKENLADVKTEDFEKLVERIELASKTIISELEGHK